MRVVANCYSFFVTFSHLSFTPRQSIQIPCYESNDNGGVTYGQVAKVAHPAIADGCREEFDSSRFFLEALLATTTYETFLGLMMTEARRVKDKRDSKLDTIDEDEEKGSHK